MMSPRTVVALLVTLFIGANGYEYSDDYARVKRGAAYSGPHPGNGYGSEGVGIPGLYNAAQYKAYATLLSNSNSHQQQPSYGHGHRKLTVDQAIGMFGHHSMSRSYPYVSNHQQGGSSGHGGGASQRNSGGHQRRGGSSRSSGYGGSSNAYHR